MRARGGSRAIAAASLLAAGLAASTAPAAALEVSIQRRPGFDPAAYRTYAWSPRPELADGHPAAAGGPVDVAVRAAADRALAERGLERVERDGEPDLLVAYSGWVEDLLTVEGERREIAPGVTWIGDPDAHWLRHGAEATLVLILTDAASDETVWSGWAVGVAESVPELEKKAPKAARKILKHYPRR